MMCRKGALKLKLLDVKPLVPMADTCRIKVYMGNDLSQINNQHVITTDRWENIPSAVMNMEVTLICPDRLSKEGYGELMLRVEEIKYSDIFTCENDCHNPVFSPTEGIHYGAEGYQRVFVGKEGVVYAIEVFSFCIYDGSTDSLGYEYALLPFEVFSFEYGGKHFIPHATLDEVFDLPGIKLRSDPELGFFKKDFVAKHRVIKFDYSREEFYKAMNHSEMDIFKCVETDNLHVPGENELFIYEGTRTGEN